MRIIGQAYLDDPAILALSEGTAAMKLDYIWNCFSTATLGCVKLSALLFYRRHFCIHGLVPWFKIANTVTIIVAALWTVTYITFTIFQCGTHFDLDMDNLGMEPGRDALKARYCAYQNDCWISLVISDVILDFGFAATVARMVIWLQLLKADLSYVLEHDPGRE
ncbi:hypothetical protein ANO11243_080200 [Dothideomycetidae sp. 11243]|nr:hypothetical protein ANO11243_080200 [fungal sp. No.11243]